MADTKITPRVRPPSVSGRRSEPARSISIEGGKRVNVMLDEQEHEELKILAIRHKKTVSDVIRGFVRDYLKKGGVQLGKGAHAAGDDTSHSE
jgi:hypothetical protein